MVGIYILYKLKDLKINLGLYRDDMLGVTSLRPRLLELEKKKLAKIMKEIGLNIILEPSTYETDFLDITLNLKTGIIKPYFKPNNVIKYVHKDSNHPKHIIDNLPKSIETRLSSLSSSMEIFNKSKNTYQEGLNNAGTSMVWSTMRT